MSLYGTGQPITAGSLADHGRKQEGGIHGSPNVTADPVATILKEFERGVTLREYDDAQQMGLYQNVLSEHGRSGRYVRHDARAMAAEILRLREAQRKPVAPEPAWQYGIGHDGCDYRARGWNQVERKRVADWVPVQEVPTRDVELVASLIAKARRQEKKP